MRAEPEFVFCFYGDEALRQIGPNYEGLVDKTNKICNLGEGLDWDGLDQSKRWVPYGTRFEHYYNHVLREKRQSEYSYI